MKKVLELFVSGDGFLVFLCIIILIILIILAYLILMQITDKSDEEKEYEEIMRQHSKSNMSKRELKRKL